MDGIHDMGGMHGFGPIGHRSDAEPVFRELWEARLFAVAMAMGAHGLWTADEERHAIERIPPEDYLALSYYERWLAGYERLLSERGMNGHTDQAHGKGGARASAQNNANVHSLLAAITAGAPAARPTGPAPAFAVGQAVRARNIHPPGHTRLPRYVRGRVGVVERLHGVHVLPDANAHGRGERPEPLYGVFFAAEELWGADPPLRGDGVHLDLWQSYLDTA